MLARAHPRARHRFHACRWRGPCRSGPPVQPARSLRSDRLAGHPTPTRILRWQLQASGQARVPRRLAVAERGSVSSLRSPAHLAPLRTWRARGQATGRPLLLRRPGIPAVSPVRASPATTALQASRQSAPRGGLPVPPRNRAAAHRPACRDPGWYGKAAGDRPQSPAQGPPRGFEGAAVPGTLRGY